MIQILGALSCLHLLIIGAGSSSFGSSTMPPTILTLQMIIDYAVEENWKQVVFFDCIGQADCTRPYARPLLECFFDKGIHMSIQSLTEKSDLSKLLRVEVHKVGVILLIDDINLNVEDNLLRKIMLHNKNARSQILGEYTAWLLLSTIWNNTQIFEAVKNWPIGVDSSVTVAMSFLSADVVLSVWNQFMNKTCENLRSYGQRYDYARLSRSQSVAPPEATFVQDTENASRTIMVFYMVSVYKIRIDRNASLVKEEWNTWNPSRRFTIKDRTTPKQRNDLKHHVMNFGLQNSSRFYGSSSFSGDGDHASSVESLIELINLFERCLNVSANITNYVFGETAQVTKENNDLVHGITNGDIDIGAAYFDVDLDRNKLLSFSYPIVHFSRSIYFKPPDAYSNIFLLPFSKPLLFSVLATIVLIVTVMEMINYVTLFIHWKEDEEHFGLGEALLWSLSIMCTQGSPWTPRTRAGKTVLLANLMFALIIYNSYSGFITSILSVKTSHINNVSDFFKYDYSFGCSKSDDNYLVSNEELRNFYVKALEADQMKVPEKEGLEKALNGSYAFFISETVAKRILRNALMFQRCNIREYPTHTPGTMALPISDDTPYKKIINVSILRMWQYGMLRKLTLKIKPPLLDCKGSTNFKQAHLADVYGAFCILLIGAVASVGLFFMERTWASRRGIQQRIVGLHHHDVRGIGRRSRDIFVTARLPMRIIGIDRDARDGKSPAKSNSIKNSHFRLFFPRSRKRDRDELTKNPTIQSNTFPYAN